MLLHKTWQRHAPLAAQGCEQPQLVLQVARVLEEERQRLYGPPQGSGSGYNDEDEDEDEGGFFEVEDEKDLIGFSSDDIFKKPGPFDSMFAGESSPAGRKAGNKQR